jgi:hypothetical protein
MLQPGHFIPGRRQFGGGMIKGGLQGVALKAKAIPFSLENVDCRCIMKRRIKKRIRPRGGLEVNIIKVAAALRHAGKYTCARIVPSTT